MYPITLYFFISVLWFTFGSRILRVNIFNSYLKEVRKVVLFRPVAVKTITIFFLRVSIYIIVNGKCLKKSNIQFFTVSFMLIEILFSHTLKLRKCTLRL